MAEVIYQNDGKGRRQSWEASVSLNETVPDGAFYVEVNGFGANKEEAAANLAGALRAAIQRADEMLFGLRSK